MAACAALATAGIAGCGGTDDGGGDDGLEPVDDGGDDAGSDDGGDDGGGGGPPPAEPVGPPPGQPPDDPGPPDVEELETYTNDEWGFSILYPAAWVWEEHSDESALSLVFFSEDEGAWLSVDIVEAGESTLEDVIAAIQESVRDQEGWELFDERRMTLSGGQEAWVANVRFVETYEHEGEEHEQEWRTKILVTADDDRFFIVQMGAFPGLYTEEFDERAVEVLESLDIQ